MKKINLNILLLIGFFFILFNKLDFFKKTYVVSTTSYEKRFLKAYDADYFSGFCKKESHGYIYYIKKKFSINFSPKIINFEEKKRKLPYWIFYKPYGDINEKELILLNYDPKIRFVFNDYNILDNYNGKCFYLKKNDRIN